MNNSEIKKAINDIASYMVICLSETQHISRNEALEKVMQTAVYAALLDPATELYCEPKDAVYNMLQEEMSDHPEKLLQT